MPIMATIGLIIMYEVITPLICVAIGGIVVGIIAGWFLKTWYVADLVNDKIELIDNKTDMIEVLNERISLGNEHISALNDQVKNDRLLLGVLNDQLKFRNDKIAELENALR